MNTLKSAFKLKEVRNRIFFTLFMLVLVRFGSQLPAPGVNKDFFKTLFQMGSGGTFSFFDAFTGGSFSNFSIFALNITPYITSSIIIQLLTIAIPQLEEQQREGPEGRKRVNQITRLLTVGLALIESTAMVIGFGRQGLIVNMNTITVVTAIATLTAGSAFIMWIGERITEKGIGNGISIVLVINIISRIPSDLIGLYQKFVAGKAVGQMVLAAVIILVVILLIVNFTVILNGAVRQIPVQYTKKVAGRGQNFFIPLKVNTANVMPVIFASSIMQFPIVIAAFAGKSEAQGIWGQILRGLDTQKWFNFYTYPKATLGVLVYIALLIFFAYFYTSITFNPIEVADQIKKQGGYIHGVRPGKPTVDFLNQILKYIIFIGAAGLLVIAILPLVFNGIFGAQVSFGGTSIIIIVSVILETLKQVKSLVLVQEYRGKGFLSA